MGAHCEGRTFLQLEGTKGGRRRIKSDTHRDIKFQFYFLVGEVRVTMTTFWRAAGLNYVQYSSIAAHVVRSCLKPDQADAAAKRAATTIKFQRWENGKPIGEKKAI